MQYCKYCGAVLEDGMLCDCTEAQKDRAMVKEVMLVCVEYLKMLADDDDPLNDEAFRTVMTEIADKYGANPKELMAKAIDSMEEFIEEE